MYKLASGVERRRCVSMVESSAGDRAYYFLLATVYYNVLSGSVFGILEKVLANPKAFFQYAAHVLPRVSNYFIMLLFGMFAEVGMILVQACVTPLREHFEYGTFIFPFFKVLPRIWFVFTVMLLYAIIQPVTSWVALAFFVVARPIFRRVFAAHSETYPAVAGEGEFLVGFF